MLFYYYFFVLKIEETKSGQTAMFEILLSLKQKHTFVKRKKIHCTEYVLLLRTAG